MANGHGGNRLGAGRKPKDASLRAIDGNAGHRARVLKHPSGADPDPVVAMPAVIVDEQHAPDDLDTSERLVWLRLGKLAVEAGTLTVRYADDFKELCRHIVAERGFWTLTAETMGPDHRALIKIIHGEKDRFALRPFGKPAAETPAVPAVDPMKEKYLGRG